MTIYCVCRISVDRDRDSISIETQQTLIADYCRRRFGSIDDLVWIVDRNVSGAVPLLSRPAGSALAQVRRGDHVVAAKLDRLFRSMADGSAVIERLVRLEVGLHCLDLQLDTSTPIGRAMIHIVIAFAQLERERIGERHRDANRQRRQAGRPWARHAAIGWRHVWITGQDGKAVRVFQPAPEQRRLANRLQRLNDGGIGYHRLLAMSRAKGWQHKGRPLTRVTLRRLIRAARDSFPIISYECRRYGSARHDELTCRDEGASR